MMGANFLTGPVALKPAVLAALRAPPISHRDPEFLAVLARARQTLRSLTHAEPTLLLGSGTLANDAVAAQLTEMEGPGLILANGEFGDRLVDHARRWRLAFSTERCPWGEAFDWQRIAAIAESLRPRWIWAVLTETSTGVENPLPELRRLCERVGADLCLDAISAVGVIPVDLSGVRFATAVSGKGLAAPPGIAMVFHDGGLASGAHLPRYLDLRKYEADEGVPFTQSSNLLSALTCSLATTDWSRKFERIRNLSRALRIELVSHGFAPLARDDIASPGVLTLAIEPCIAAGDVAHALRDCGIEVASQSTYLRQRNWLQIALMGEVDEAAMNRLPAALAIICPLSASRMLPGRCRKPARTDRPG